MTDWSSRGASRSNNVGTEAMELKAQLTALHASTQTAMAKVANFAPSASRASSKKRLACNSDAATSSMQTVCFSSSSTAGTRSKSPLHSWLARAASKRSKTLAALRSTQSFRFSATFALRLSKWLLQQHKTKASPTMSVFRRPVTTTKATYLASQCTHALSTSAMTARSHTSGAWLTASNSSTMKTR